MIGYSLQIGPQVFDAWRDGTPFTLADAWRESLGVGHCHLLHGDRVVLLRCGNLSVRDNVRHEYAQTAVRYPRPVRSLP